MSDELPELTDEERAAIDAMDMAEILGTWEERCDVAMQAAKRWFRERNALRAQLAAAEARVSDRNEAIAVFQDVVESMKAQLAVAEDRATALQRAIDAGEWDISPCMVCGQPLVCLPDGMPMCAACARKERG